MSMCGCVRCIRRSACMLRVIRKWRLLNALVLLFCIFFLCRTLRSLPFNTIYINKVYTSTTPPKPRLDSPSILRLAKKATDIDLELIAESQQFIVSKKPAIPKIIHQIYRNDSIPKVYANLIKSWMNKNPDYEYWFWDDNTGRKFIATSYPEYLALYDAYCHDLFRSDALRYFILYEFGGLYIDMDYECLRGLDGLLNNHHCHVVQEHVPQAQLLYDKDDMVLNAWMASVPYHPFMHFLINNLASRAKCKFVEVLKSTGPIFVYDMMKLYYNKTQCSNDLCDVNVLPYELMMPEWDAQPGTKKFQMHRCRRMHKLTHRQRKACIFFRKNRFTLPPKINPKSYATHKFMHLGNLAKKYRDKNGYVNIREIVPKVVFPLDKIIFDTRNESMNET